MIEDGIHRYLCRQWSFRPLAVFRSTALAGYARTPLSFPESSMSAQNLNQVLDLLKSDEEASISRWIDWLRIPSVSTDPKHAADNAPRRRVGSGAAPSRRVHG
jgi:hypothetical protein